MRKPMLIFAVALLLLPLASALDLTFFYGQGCPHCAQMEPFLESLEDKYNLTIKKYEVYNNLSNRELLFSVYDSFNISKSEGGVPTVVVCGKIFIGQSKEIDEKIEETIKNCENGTSASLIKKDSTSPLTLEELQKRYGLTWGVLFSAAFTDSINPCTLAVQLILLTSILTRSSSKKKALFAGLAFTLAIYVSYLLMGLGIYSALSSPAVSHIFYYIVIFIAFLVGILSVRDYFYYKPGGWAVEIPMSWRPYLKKLISGVTSPIGAAFVGLFCSLFLLPCSSGPYLVILGLLAKSSTRYAALPLLIIYNIIFVLPMIALTLLVYFNMTSVEKAQKWRERNIRKIHLISGIIMISLAILLILSLYFGWV